MGREFSLFHSIPRAVAKSVDIKREFWQRPGNSPECSFEIEIPIRVASPRRHHHIGFGPGNYLAKVTMRIAS